MSAAELKSLLHKLIVETDDLEILNRVKDYFAVIKSQKTDWWDELSQEQKKDIELGINQLEQGVGIEQSKVRAEIDLLLSKFKN